MKNKCENHIFDFAYDNIKIELNYSYIFTNIGSVKQYKNTA